MSSVFSNKKSSSCENTVLKAGDKTEASVRHTSKQRRRWYVKLSAVDGRVHEETVIDSFAKGKADNKCSIWTDIKKANFVQFRLK